MKYTTNLNLKKPDLTDYVDIGDVNENMDVIDAELKSIRSDDIQALAGTGRTTETVKGNADAILEHIHAPIYSEEGHHGVRYYNNLLQYYDGDVWVTIEWLNAVNEDTSPSLGGELNSGEHSIGFTEKVTVPVSGVANIDWKTSNKQLFILTDNSTLTFTPPSNPCNLLLRIKQDSAGGKALTLPTVKWPNGEAPTFTTTAHAVDILSLYYDGLYYYGMASLNFS